MRQIEIIVPISLTPIQKHVYKSILERNAEILKAIAQSRKRRTGTKIEGPTGPTREGAPTIIA